RLYEAYTQNLYLWTERLEREMSEKITSYQHDLRVYNMQLQSHNPLNLVRQKEDNLQQMTAQLRAEINRYMETHQQRLDYGIQSLDYLSPLKIMHREYSYALKDDTIIKSTNDVNIGETIDIHLSDGKLTAKVTEKMEDTHG